ncbi:hypothetical protein FHW36_10497 [Chitinophaga polysaccharea]|uniref:Uncharacterized protein n=1 Tax=Chitinophaga polysaccharea TaxID=1293035 RepID=A0A561PQL9_9BACT|nr:hypothetical protein [Chitinophaga polysaccharea]TWF40415.1 hypothetical protein FHW36_10497 [Chitinophaga polysaccharea]
MKKKLFGFFAGIMIISAGIFATKAFSQVETLSGCRWSGNPSDYCVIVLNGQLWGVTSCVNSDNGGSCGIQQ